jgi:hypothetical protein
MKTYTLDQVKEIAREVFDDFDIDFVVVPEHVGCLYDWEDSAACEVCNKLCDDADEQALDAAFERAFTAAIGKRS